MLKFKITSVSKRMKKTNGIRGEPVMQVTLLVQGIGNIFPKKSDSC